jgi:hypothetical protein
VRDVQFLFVVYYYLHVVCNILFAENNYLFKYLLIGVEINYYVLKIFMKKLSKYSQVRRFCRKRLNGAIKILFGYSI